MNEPGDLRNLLRSCLYASNRELKQQFNVSWKILDIALS